MKIMIKILCISLMTAPVLWAADETDLWTQGRRAWYDSDWEKAAKSFKELLDSYPDSRFSCKSGYYLGYCYDKMNERRKAFDAFSWVIEHNNCRSSTVVDAKSKRLEIAFFFAREDDAYKRVLQTALRDGNIDIRLQAAVWLSQLNDKSGMDVFFEVLEKESDRDRQDTAVKNILKLGDEEEKARLEKFLDERGATVGGKPKMVRLIIRDLSTNQEKVKVNLPIGLFNVAIQSLSDQQLRTIQSEAGIDLRNLDLNLEDLPAGKILFRVVNDGEEIKLFLD
jgi:tetratricopeptide (TPR) repeat protein